MTAIASDDTPEEWSQWDDVALEVYSHIDLIERLGDFNTLVYFTDKLFMDEMVHKVELDPDHAETMRNFLDQAIKVDNIIKKYLGENYIADFMKTLDSLDTEDNDDET